MNKKSIKIKAAEIKIQHAKLPNWQPSFFFQLNKAMRTLPVNFICRDRWQNYQSEPVKRSPNIQDE